MDEKKFLWPPLYFKSNSSLSVICPLIEKKVSLEHEVFPISGNNGKISTIDFKGCEHSERGGSVFCRYPENNYQSCNPFLYLTEAAKTESLKMGEAKTLADENGNPLTIYPKNNK